MMHCCLPNQRPCFAPARALGAGRATVPRTSSQRPCRAPAARLGSVGTFSVVTYVNCLRPTAAELLPLFSIFFMHQLTPAPQHLLSLEARHSLSLRRTRAASNRATAAYFHGVLAFRGHAVLPCSHTGSLCCQRIRREQAEPSVIRREASRSPPCAIRQLRDGGKNARTALTRRRRA